MSTLHKFKEDLEDAGGVSEASITDGTLRVTYLSPSNYSTARGEVRRDYPQVVQVDREESHTGVTLVYEVEDE